MFASLFGPRMVDYNGTPMTRAGIRELERQKLQVERERANIALDRDRRIATAKAALAEAAAEKAKLELAEVQAVHDEKHAEVVEAEKAEAAKLKVQQRVKRYRRRNVAAVVVMCILIEYGGQWLFFSDFLPEKFKAFLWVAPLVVPVFSWGFGIDAFLRALDKVPYAKSMMVMWVSAIAATVMIAVDLVIEFKNPGWAIFMGLASIFGPLIFHLHVGSAADEAHEISALERAKLIARKWGNRLRHPFIWWGAVDLYHSSVGALSFDGAWLMVYRQKRGHLPGALPIKPAVVYVPDFEVRRLRWLRRLLDRFVFGKSNATSNIAVSNTASNIASNEVAGRHAITAGESSNVAPDVAPAALLTSQEQHSNVALPESAAEVTAPMSPLLNEIDAWLKSNGADVAAADLAAGANEIDTLLATRLRRPGGVAQQATSNAGSNSNVDEPLSNASTSNARSNVRRLFTRDKQRPSNTASNAGVSNTTSNEASNVSAAELVRRWVDEQRAQGVALAEITGTNAADAVNKQLVEDGREPVTRQAADNAVRLYRNKLQEQERREA